MSFQWDKGVYPKWKDKVDYELMEIRMHITSLEAQLKGGGRGGGTGGGKGATSDFTDISQFGFNKEEAVSKLTDIEEEEVEGKSYTDMLVEQTYALKTATIAAKGYLMLLDQMGLSKDQKHMVRDLEYGMMAIMKGAQAVMIGKGIMEAASLNPMAILTFGGYVAGSVAYSSKLSGGGV